MDNSIFIMGQKFLNLSSPFIHRPVMTTLMMAAIFLFGLMAFKKMPVSDLPDVDYPTIRVTASMPGGNPEYMAHSVANPLEQAFTTISGLNTMTSENTYGQTEIILNFDLNRNLDNAELEVQGAISRTLPLLPSMPNNPLFERVNPSQSPILYLTLSSETQPLSQLYEYAKNLLVEPISMIHGVSEVNIYGYPYAVRVQANPAALYARGLDYISLSNLLVKSNPNLPGGNMISPFRGLIIEPFGMLTSGPEYNEIILKQEEGLFLKLQGIGEAASGLQGRDPYFYLNTRNSKKGTVAIAIKRQNNANTIEVIKKINNKLPELQKSLPASIALATFFDDASAIIASIHDVEWTLVICLLLAVGVIFFSLGNFAETIIPSIVLPLSILGTFIVIHLLHFSIDTLSLLALTLAIGFIVDDAVVVLENIVRLIRLKKTPFEAALEGSKEISTTVLTMTIALSAVFIPMIAMPGMLGRIFREFSITIVITILFSGFISLTLSPMLCSRFLRSHKNRFALLSEKMHEKGLAIYLKYLQKALSYKKTFLFTGCGCFVFSFILFNALPFDFFPATDLSLIEGMTQCEQGSSIINTNQHQADVDRVIATNPHVETFLSLTGNPTSDQGLLFIRLLPASKRPTIKKIIVSLTQELRLIPGMNTFLMPLPLISLQVGNTSGIGEYQFALSSLYPEKLYKSAHLMIEELKKIPEISGINSDMKTETPQINFHLLRERAGMFGVHAEDIEKTLQFAFSGGRISTFNRNHNLYDLILETQHDYQHHIDDLDYLYVKSAETGALVPLSSLARWEEVIGPSAINHLNQLPSVTISFNLAPHASLGTAVKKIQALAKKVLPSNIMDHFIGEAEVFLETINALKWLILLALIIIYLLLGILYESFLHPLTVLSALPPACFGALLTLLLFNQSLSLYSVLGLIVLIGLVQKNGIMLIDYALANMQKQQLPAQKAILEACSVRFRPIMMTTLAAMMGALPIALGFGDAEGVKRSLGLAILGGLLFSQGLTLFMTPIVFLTLESLKQKLQKINSKACKITKQSKP